MRIGQFRCPDGDGSVQMSTSDPADDSREGQPGDILGRREQGRSQHSPETAQLNGLQTTNRVGEIADRQSAFASMSVRTRISKVIYKQVL